MDSKLVALAIPGTFHRRGAALFLLPARWLPGGGALLALSIPGGLTACGSVPSRTELSWRFAWSGTAP